MCVHVCCYLVHFELLFTLVMCALASGTLEPDLAV